MKLMIEYAGDYSDKEAGVQKIEVEFEKDTDTEIAIEGEGTVRIRAHGMPGYVVRTPFGLGDFFKSKKDLQGARSKDAGKG